MERRLRRSEKPGEAVRLYLEALRERTGMHGVALANEDGLLVAGAGEDLDWLAAVGASSTRSTVQWGDRTVHVRRMRVHSEDVSLASTGALANDEAARSISRIFAA